MLSKLQKSNNKGFTIIEVMIVLAIAGLIILIVLLAIPALQRNGRNTALKNDASAISAGVSEFSSNNDGASPTAAGSSYAANSGNVILNTATGTQVTARVQSSTAVTFQTGAGAVTVTPGAIVVAFGARCGTNAGAVHTPVAQPRSTAVIYGIENTGATPLVARCVEA
jgi:prepilin-type N-terminal cleavage/methylation domain-containing protein